MSGVTKEQADRCVTHHACDCHLYRLQEAERELKDAVALLRRVQRVLPSSSDWTLRQEINTLIWRGGW